KPRLGATRRRVQSERQEPTEELHAAGAYQPFPPMGGRALGHIDLALDFDHPAARGEPLQPDRALVAELLPPYRAPTMHAPPSRCHGRLTRTVLTVGRGGVCMERNRWVWSCSALIALGLVAACGNRSSSQGSSSGPGGAGSGSGSGSVTGSSGSAGTGGAQ